MARGSNVTSVAASATSVALFASSEAAIARIIVNDSAAVLYVKYGATASTTSYTVQIPANGLFEFPNPFYGGVVEGIWSSATGNARLTEVFG